jgi:hypothetical protein
MTRVVGSGFSAGLIDPDPLKMVQTVEDGVAGEVSIASDTPSPREIMAIAVGNGAEAVADPLEPVGTVVVLVAEAVTTADVIRANRDKVILLISS